MNSTMAHHGMWSRQVVLFFLCCLWWHHADTQTTCTQEQMETFVKETMKEVKEETMKEIREEIKEEFEKTIETKLEAFEKTIDTKLESLGKAFDQKLQLFSRDECLTNPCQNGGTCVNAIGDFVCKCRSLYVGSTCQLLLPGLLPGPQMKPHASSAYVISATKYSWNASRAFCQSLGGDLAATETDSEWKHVYDEVARVDGGEAHWLGGRRVDGVWRWGDGQVIDAGHAPWYKNGGMENANCLLMGYPNFPSLSYTNAWFRYFCTTAKAKRSICEMQ